MKLAILGIGAIDWFKRDQFCRIRCEVGSMLLHPPSGVMAVFNIVGSAISRIYNPPGTSEGKFKFAHTTFRVIGTNGMARKRNVIGFVDSGVMPT